MKRRREVQDMLARRLIMAWQMKVWPWSLPWQTVKWVSLDQRLSPEEQARGLELAKQLKSSDSVAGPHQSPRQEIA